MIAFMKFLVWEWESCCFKQVLIKCVLKHVESISFPFFKEHHAIVTSIWKRNRSDFITPMPMMSPAIDHLRVIIENLHHCPLAQQRSIIRLYLKRYPMEPRLWVVAVGIEKQDGYTSTALALLREALQHHPHDEYLLALQSKYSLIWVFMKHYKFSQHAIDQLWLDYILMSFSLQ